MKKNMNGSLPIIRVQVNPTNPGQFLACCGMLEIANILHPGSVGWFDNGYFHIDSKVDIRKLLETLVDSPPVDVVDLGCGVIVDSAISQMKIKIDKTELILDGWMSIHVDKGNVTVWGNRPWKFWTGLQTVKQIWMNLRASLIKQLGKVKDDEIDQLFSMTVLLKGRFGFDPGAAWNSVDVGFSPNEQGMLVGSSPSVEMLAIIGLQRFRLDVSQKKDTITYSTWGRPLSPSLASVAASGNITVKPSLRFSCKVSKRGKYTALGNAVLKEIP